MNKYLRLFFLVLALAVLSYWLLFRKNPPRIKEPVQIAHREPNGLPDSVITSAGSHYTRGTIGQVFLGEHNRSVWTAPVKVKVFYLRQERGGLTIQSVGGGMQTLSFTLTDSAGRTYALRSVDKDPISVLPPFWQKTVAGSFIRDQISGANPYGALVVPGVAKAAGIFHASPQLRYILPQDSSFGPHAARARGELFMLEEKYTNNPVFYPELENAIAVVNTAVMLQNCSRYPTHRVDADSYLTCRLFDFLIGDWDRHTGQWMWAVYKQGAETWYKPIPKDRDQAFCKYQDGLLPWLATRRWVLPKFGHFTPDLKNIYGLTKNAAYLDKMLLPSLSEERYLNAARQLQQTITNNVIDQSVQKLPVSVMKLAGLEISANLKSRRNQLPAAAYQFYSLIAKEKGTNNHSSENKQPL